MVKRKPTRNSVVEPDVPVHRAIWRLHLPWSRVVGGFLLASLLSWALLLMRPWIAKFWSAVLLWWLQALELPGRFVAQSEALDDTISLSVPTFEARLSTADAGVLFWHLAAVVLVWMIAGWQRDAVKPLAFAARLLALTHGIAVLFFMFWPASFVQSLSEHVKSGLEQIWFLTLLTPWVHLLTYYLFPIGYAFRAALSLLTIAYLLVLAPNLYALHIALVAHLGMVMMPVLGLLLGVLLAVIGFVGLYGWGMSWPTVTRRRNETA